tara:strand:- start:264 stop:683 length:420 start_codon:yes stop_codon:yes gene_type:complete
MNLGNILAIALPLLAGTVGGGTPSKKGGSKEGSFLTDMADAFVQVTGAGDTQQPFAYRQVDARARPVQELTRGNPMGGPTIAAAQQFSGFQSPMMQRVMDKLQYSNNSQVKDLLREYGVVSPNIGRSPPTINLESSKVQ